MQRTNTWFEDTCKATWDELMPQLKPRKILEVGSYEGASSIYLMGLKPSAMICVDTWPDPEVEKRFRRNIGELRKQPWIEKGRSDVVLAGLLGDAEVGVGADYFDFIYIDGSHEAPDVLMDAMLGWRLLVPGGVMGFDDYGGGAGVCSAVDMFLSVHKPEVILSGYQLYVRK